MQIGWPRYAVSVRAGVLGLALVAGLIAQGSFARAGGKSAPPSPMPVMRKVTVARVEQKTREQALDSAAKIDKLIDANYAKYKITPNPPASDEVFIRRLYLDVTGTIPTTKQVKTALSQKDEERRDRLVDATLNSPGYASHFYNYWADLLRLSERLGNSDIPGRPYNEWVRICLETNRPYDKMVYEMLTAEGKVYDHPPAGYILRDAGMPLDAMNNTVRIFLGTQIGCAQCHDHPFDRWTQMEFYEMAAYTFGAQTRRSGKDEMYGGKNVIQDLRTGLAKMDAKYDGGNKYNRFLNGNTFEVFDKPRTLHLPHDYQYADGKPNDKVAPHALFDPQPKVRPGETPRVAFARWLTSPENPRFAQTIANRMWKRLFGIGQIEPPDDIRDDTLAENPELMAFLTAEMIRLNFDLKEFQRILLNTKAYQRQTTSAEVTPGDEYHFPGPVLRRMTAEQVWDSFITLAVYEPDKYQMEPAALQSSYLGMDLTRVTAEEVYLRHEGLQVISSGKFRDLRDKPYKYKGLLLVRASEVPTPCPPSHFLRQFGQSDRESIQGSSTYGAVPQILQMFNGPVTHMLLEPTSQMFAHVIAEEKPEARVQVIFLSILSRRPTPEEAAAALEEINAAGPAGYGNVIWALVNTREFLFIQ